jgi:hypothetical protein
MKLDGASRRPHNRDGDLAIIADSAHNKARGVMAQKSPGSDDPAAFLKRLAADDGTRDADIPPAPPSAGDPAPETIDVKCQCGKTLRVKGRLAGKTVKCPACETPLTVPAPEPAPAAETPEGCVVAEAASFRAKGPGTEAGGFGYAATPEGFAAAAPSAAPAAIAIDVAAATSRANYIRSRRKRQTPLRWMLIGAGALAVVVPVVYFLAFHKTSRGRKEADSSLAANSPSDDGAADSAKSDDVPPADADPVKPRLNVADSTSHRKTDWQSVLPAKKKADPPKVVVKEPAKKTPAPAETGKTEKKPTKPAQPALVVSAEAFDWLVGKGRTITLHTGDVYDEVEVASVKPGPKPRSLHSLKLKRPTGKAARQKKRPPSPLYARLIHTIETPDGLLTLKYDKTLKMAVVEQVATQQQLAAERAKRRAEIVARLRTRGHKIWPELSKENHAKAVAEYKEFLIKVGKLFTDRTMKFRETAYFLFYTDLPDAEVELISRRLDAMYRELCKAFGIRAGKNIWRGKCVIVAFYRKQDFMTFEIQIMKHTPEGTVQGLMHGNYRGRCITACYRGDAFDYFAQVLVHETSHGFVHRYFSTAQLPSWVNEGMADWIANMVVPVAKHIRRKQADAVARLRTTRTLGGNFFTAVSIDPWQYGVASHLTEFMLRGGNGLKYRRFIDDMKKGFTWQESLKRNYGVDEKGLITLYGQSLRIANLVP